MPESITQTVGIDISKHRLDVAFLLENTTQTFDNSPKGIKTLMMELAKKRPESIIFEATGAYHLLLERTLLQNGFRCVKVNPLQARRFAEATGKRVKTDKVDAVMLAQFGALLKPSPQKLKSDALYKLAELLKAREALVKDRTATKNRQKNLLLDILKRQCNQRLKQIERQIKAIEIACREIIDNQPDLHKKITILQSIPGMGFITAIMLLTFMPELGSINQKQAASLAGLAPITRQSGQWTGKAYIRGGRKIVRDALYMPALVAMRFNPQMKEKYQTLINAGKPAKVAITAVMRKTIVLANALLRKEKLWMPLNS